MLENILLNPKTIAILLIWMMPWKAMALWKSARNSQKIWFTAILLMQTAAILEIIYILFFQKKRK